MWLVCNLHYARKQNKKKTIVRLPFTHEHEHEHEPHYSALTIHSFGGPLVVVVPQSFRRLDWHRPLGAMATIVIGAATIKAQVFTRCNSASLPVGQ